MLLYSLSTVLVCLSMRSSAVSNRERIRWENGSLGTCSPHSCLHASACLCCSAQRWVYGRCCFSASSSTGNVRKSSSMSCRAGDGRHCLRKSTSLFVRRKTITVKQSSSCNMYVKNQFKGGMRKKESK